MTFIKTITLCTVLAVLTACGASNRIAVQSPEITQNVRIGFASVEVRDVSLPGYAAADEITQQMPDGTLIASDVLWGDTPARAIGLELSRALAELTNARIAPEPWPFEEDAAASLDIRFVDLVAGTDGVFRAAGQYFVGVYQGRERAGQFELSVPYDVDGGPASIARARGQIISDLAVYVARNGLR